MSKELPSIEDFANDNNLPSINEFIVEGVEQLPSVEDYVEKEEVEEIVEEPVAEETESPIDLTEIIRLINDVRKDIPEIPEVKYYDAELEKLCEIVDQVRSEVIDTKHYEEEIERLEKNIQEVKSEIPVFPKWVSEVDEAPDFSWIGKSFRSVDEDFVKINDSIETLKDKIQLDFDRLSEYNDIKTFENKIEFKNEIKDIDEKYQTYKNEIYTKLEEITLKIWEYHKEFKDDDRKLKKQISGEYNSLKNNLEEKIKEFNNNSVKTDELLLNYFEGLKEEVSNIPEVKYYDNQIGEVNTKIEKIDNRLLSLNELYEIVESIKSSQTELKEQLLSQPPSVDNKDSLTPLDQNFATLEDLSSHYRLFINRIQQQLATIGGGGETRLEFLDDVDRNTAKQNGYVLQYSSSVGKFIGTSYVPGGGGNVAIAITNVAPTNPQEGNLWYDLDIGRTFIYYTDVDGSQWVDANPAGSLTTNESYWISNVSGIHTTSNVGIGSTQPTVKLDVQGDVKVGINTSQGLILTDENGVGWRLNVNTDGSLSTTLV